ncbi:MAG TPA: hypothetical protein DEA43_00040 [Candidatus Moranbacteria bacterium]|nr:hypothetical protein [Candidatus Moranbacteria bacterium]HBT45262.1 hypothetical protein [Candidatus Moranbacteria bacterium]
MGSMLIFVFLFSFWHVFDPRLWSKTQRIAVAIIGQKENRKTKISKVIFFKRQTLSRSIV